MDQLEKRLERRAFFRTAVIVAASGLITAIDTTNTVHAQKDQATPFKKTSLKTDIATVANNDTARNIANVSKLLLTPSPATRQDNWRHCWKCKNLWWAGAGSGVCPAGGGRDARGSWNFELVTSESAFSGQDNWRHCWKCGTLWWPGAGSGTCPAGGGHDARDSWNFKLATTKSGIAGQDNWRHCWKCKNLWWAGAGSGVCPAGGGHNARGSWNFVLPSIDAAPDQLGPFDTKYITFDNGVPVGGYAQLTLFKSGAYNFTGHFRDSGAIGYDVGFVYGLRSPSGVLYTFSQRGHVHGTIPPGSRDFDWSTSGTNPALADGWTDLASQRNWHDNAQWEAEATADLMGLLNSLLAAFKAIKEVVTIVVAIV